MQTPAGYEIIDGRFFPTDWLQVVFNPSFPSRLAHTVVAFFITTGFVVMGVGAYLMRRGKFAEEGRVMLSMTLWLLTVWCRCKSSSATITGSTRESTSRPSLRRSRRVGKPGAGSDYAVRDPRRENRTNYFSIDVPLLGSLDPDSRVDGEVKGLKDFPADQRPPVAIPFFAFRIMVGCGLVMLGVVLLGGLAPLARPARRYAALSATLLSW